jgi:hypothetical protein
VIHLPVSHPAKGEFTGFSTLIRTNRYGSAYKVITLIPENAFVPWKLGFKSRTC